MQGVKVLRQFELPDKLKRVDQTATDTYAMFVAEPFEAGFAHSVGNALRRVLLSSIEGAAVTSISIDGVSHEFQAIPGVREDVTDIILNVKKVLFKKNSNEAVNLTINTNKSGPILARDITGDGEFEILNSNQIICTLDKKQQFSARLVLESGRGYALASHNAEHAKIGLLPIDALFSPVTLVKYAVEDTRVGQMTDYDKLVLEIWTDGRVSPSNALKESAAILKHHLDIFDVASSEDVKFETSVRKTSDDQNSLRKLFGMSVNEIELSVRAANCLNNANINTVGDLVTKSEAEMLKYRNFGKKSLNEIKEKLEAIGLSLGMSIDESLMRD